MNHVKVENLGFFYWKFEILHIFFHFLQKRPLKQLTFADLVGQVLAGIRQMRFRTSAATGAFQRRRSNYGTSSEIWGFNSLWKIDPRPKNISKINLLALIAVIGLCSGEFCVSTSIYRLFFIWKWLKRWLWQVLQRWFWQVLLPEGYLGQGWRATFGLPGKNMPSSRRSILFSPPNYSQDKLYLRFSSFAVCWCAEKRRHCGGGLQFCPCLTIIVKIYNQEDFLRNVTKISLEVVISSLQYHFHTCCKYSWSPSEPTAVLRFKKTSMSFHFALDLHQEAICRSFLKRPTESMPSIYLTLLNMDINNFETGNRI